MRSKKRFTRIPLILMGVFVVFASSCDKDSVSNNDSNNGGNNAGIPVLTTTEVTEITMTTAISGGNISSDGGGTVTARGVCYSTGHNPTINDNKTTDSTGIGNFISTLEDLSANTTYYVRAYAINQVGTGYGSEESFTTFPDYTGQVGSVTDIDGNNYNTIGIGTQIWMAENLKTTKYRNGISIPEIYTWDVLVNSGPGYGYPGNNSNNNSLYGKLYNWYAVNSTNNICPEGWHVPSSEEFETLVYYLGNSFAGREMKTINHWHFYDSETIPTNSSGFSMLPASSLRSGGLTGVDDQGIGGVGYLWSSDDEIGYTFLYKWNDVRKRGDSKSFGFSVRCIRD